MAYETALRLNPKNAEALRGIAVLQYSIGQKGNALLNFQRLADTGAMTPRDAQVFALLAAMHGEWELANRIVDALSGGTSAALSHLVSADISSMRGKMDSAESSLRRAVEIDDSDRCRAALAGFLAPASGRVLWQDMDLTAVPPGARPISAIFQDNNLFPHLTIA